jgi:hypothetical protein
VFGDADLSNVVKERRGFERFQRVGVFDAKGPRERHAMGLDASDVAVRDLIFRVDGGREGFDRRAIHPVHLA